MRGHVHALALSTAGLPSDRTLTGAVGINARTAAAYDALLAELFIAEQIPAWSSNRLSRLIHTGKRYVIDPAWPRARQVLRGLLSSPTRTCSVA